MDRALLETIKQLQAGDESVFDTVREQYAALLLSMVSKSIATQPDAEFDDLMQEATLALYHAAMRFDLAQQKVTFGLYAKICVRNRLISARRRYQKQSSSLRVPADSSTAVERKSARRAGLGDLSDVIDTLFSDFEKSVYQLYLTGYSAGEIAAKLGKSDKSIDNAIYRVRKKIKLYFH